MPLTTILILPNTPYLGGDAVVVPRAKVHVRTQLSALPPDNQRHLGVCFQLQEAINHLGRIHIHKEGEDCRVREWVS